MSTDSGLHAALVGLIEKGSTPEGALAKGFDEILTGAADPALIAAVLTAIRIRGLPGTDLAEAARALRRHARAVAAPEDIVDTCGTGGLGWPSLNTSTAAAIVAAGAGANIAKHGNRSIPPKTGSADVLEALGVVLDPPEAAIQSCFKKARIAFLFAPIHHAAMRHAAPVRKTLRMATVFNMLGPLANPAGARRHVLGVSKAEWTRPMAEALLDLGIVHGMVVHGVSDSIDEISVSGPTTVLTLRAGEIEEHTVTPGGLGVPTHPISALKGGTPDANAEAVKRVLDGENSAFADAVAVNAGAALVVADIADGLADGCARAKAAIASGRAHETLRTLIACSSGKG